MDLVTLELAKRYVRSLAPVSARDFGARGDGLTDDTQALQSWLQYLKINPAPGYLPPGTYIISDHLDLPSHSIIYGAGRGVSIIKAKDDTIFGAVKIHEGVDDSRDRRYMIAPDTRGDNGRAKDIVLAHLTIDWSHCPASGRSTAPLWIDSAENVIVSDVEVINADPYDQQINVDYRIHSINVTQSKNVVFENCHIGTSGYRSLGVAYGARDVTWRGGTIRTANPWRHSVEIHTGPGSRYPTVGPLRIEDAYIEVFGGAQTDIICSHHGDGLMIIRCRFHVVPGAETALNWLVKPIDGASNVWVEDCVFDLDGEYSRFFSVFDLDEGRTSGFSRVQNVRLYNNYIRLSFSSGAVDPVRSVGILTGPTLPHSSIYMVGNTVRVANAGRDFYIANVRGENIHILRNRVFFLGNATANGPHGFNLVNVNPAWVIGNSLWGSGGSARNYHNGVIIDENSRAIVKENDFTRAVGQAIINNAGDAAIIADNFV